MRRSLAVALAVAAAFAGGARAETFTVVAGEAPLPGYEVPNEPGEIVAPPAISTPPARPQVLSFGQLLALWQEAGEAYGIPWELLASINQIESDFGRNMGPSWAGAVGWMQFLPSTWERWGLDANGDGVADPWNPTDAVYAAARYLAAAGAHDDLRRAVFAYNHSDAYVDDVMAGAARFAADPLAAGLGLIDAEPAGPSLEELEAELAQARARVDELSGRAAALEDELEQGRFAIEAAERRAGNPSLSDAAFREAEAAVQAELEVQALRERDAEGTRLELEQAIADAVRLEQEIALATAEFGSVDLDGLLPAPPTEAAGRVIEEALSRLGVPYRWGGNHGFSLEQMVATEPELAYGFDCSSLLAWSFARGAGLYVGDWTGSQWEYGASAPGAVRGAGPAQGGGPPPGGYLPGDLVFFNDTDHVALYLGNDLFVHAPRTGDVVRVERLSTYAPVWGWVRYAQVSGIDVPAQLEPEAGERSPLALDEAERVFTVVVESDQAP